MNDFVFFCFVFLFVCFFAQYGFLRFHIINGRFILLLLRCLSCFWFLAIRVKGPMNVLAQVFFGTFFCYCIKDLAFIFGLCMSVTMLCIHCYAFLFISLKVCWYPWLYGLKGFHQCWTILGHYFFTYIFLSHSLFSILLGLQAHVRLFDIFPQSSVVQFFFFFSTLFFLFPFYSLFPRHYPEWSYIYINQILLFFYSTLPIMLYFTWDKSQNTCKSWQGSKWLGSLFPLVSLLLFSPSLPFFTLQLLWPLFCLCSYFDPLLKIFPLPGMLSPRYLPG